MLGLRHTHPPALDERRVKTGETGRSLYRKDASNMEGGASVVCLPDTTDEVRACVLAANRHGVPFVARGSGTGLDLVSPGVAERI